MSKKSNHKKHKLEIKETYYSLSPETKKSIFIIFLITLAIISLLSLLAMAGTVGDYINLGLGVVFGWSKIIFPLILLYIAYVMLRPTRYTLNGVNIFGLTLLVLGLNGILHAKLMGNTIYRGLSFALDEQGGGIIGLALSYPLIKFLGFWAALVLLIAITIIALMLIFNATLESLLLTDKFGRLFDFIKNPFKKPAKDSLLKGYSDDENEEEDEEETMPEKATGTNKKNCDSDEDVEGETIGENVPFKLKTITTEPEVRSLESKYANSKFKKIKIELPLSLLNNQNTKPRSGDIDLAMERISKTMNNFGIEVEMGDVSVGPTVTQYTFKPADGVNLSRITALNNNLALALAAHPIRIEAPIPGKSLVGIEVPNYQPATVTLHSVLAADSFKNIKSSLAMGLGKDVSGKCWSSDLARMPHLLVAGATGSGKSVCLNTIIVSLLYQNNPDRLRMLLVDPKRVEFTVYNGIPHLLAPVITDVTKTINALRWAIHEMDQRFDLLSKVGKRNIDSYNEAAENKMPYIVIIVDELADLMVAASAEIEASIIRLTQMARAVGIHLVVATQRPSVDVITGLIKANIPGRIAFSVASSMDSRTILDSVGAEKLIGKGDMLFQTAELSKPVRLQGAFISDDEIKRIVNHLKQVAGEPEYDESVVSKQGTKSSFDFNDDDDDDELLSEAKQLVIQSGKASASLLQRRLRVGYARAARLIDLLEDQGIVGPADGARPRDILVSKDALDDEPTTPTIFKSPTVEEEAVSDTEEGDDSIDEANDDEETTS